MRRKLSSLIPLSLTSILFVFLIVICIFSFVFLQPTDEISRIDFVAINSTQTTEYVTNSTIMINVPSTVNSSVPAKQDININTIVLKAKDLEEEQDEDDDGSFLSIDELSSPPKKVSIEARIAWFKEKLQESKLLQSTPRTSKCHDKIRSFFRSEHGADKRCKVKIFMTWISTTRLFGKRELLSLESVLKAHPLGCVVILSRTMDSNQGRTILEPLLSRGNKVLPVAPDFHLLFANTPAQQWLERLESGKVDPGSIPITQNLSNLLRLVVLYKYGGVYLDTDFIILKKLSSLRNSIGIQTMDMTSSTWKTLNNAVLMFDKGHPLLFKFIEEFDNTFNGSVWGHNGPFLVTRVVKGHMDDPMYNFNLLSPMAFYPVNWVYIHKFLEKPKNIKEINWAQEQTKRVRKVSYGIHLWNKRSRGLKIEKGSILGRLISKHCVICIDIYNS